MDDAGWQALEAGGDAPVTLTRDEIGSMVQELRRTVRLATVTDVESTVVLARVVCRLDAKLTDLLPPEMYRQVQDPDRGMPEDHAVRICARVAPHLRTAVPMPFLAERDEAHVVDEFLRMIARALRRNRSILKQSVA